MGNNYVKENKKVPNVKAKNLHTTTFTVDRKEPPSLRSPQRKVKKDPSRTSTNIRPSLQGQTRIVKSPAPSQLNNKLRVQEISGVNQVDDNSVLSPNETSFRNMLSRNSSSIQLMNIVSNSPRSSQQNSVPTAVINSAQKNRERFNSYQQSLAQKLASQKHDTRFPVINHNKNVSTHQKPAQDPLLT